MSVQVMNLSVAKPHHKVVCFKCWGCLMVNAVAHKNPKYVPQMGFEQHQYTSCESWFHSLNIGTILLIPICWVKWCTDD
jgi:hypothetical protein